MKIIWSEFDISELKNIYDYYKINVSIRIARQLKSFILGATSQLITYPESGQIEENLQELNEGHRYLVEGNYKIIYKRIGKIVYITDVFDCRQNPQKMKRNAL